MSISMEKIAKLANTSITSVSRVINNSQLVNSRTRKRIERVLKREDYVRNSLAYRLAKKKTDIIGIICHGVYAPFANFYFEVIRGAATIINEKSGYDILLQMPGPADERPPDFFTRLYDEQKIDGVMLIDPDYTIPGIINLVERQLPAVSAGSIVDNMDFVRVDHKKGALDVMEHLIGLGHKKIGMLNERSYGKDCILMLRGYGDTLEKHGLAYSKDLVIENNIHERDAYDNMRKLLEHKVTAVFCATDIIASEAVKSIRDAGLNVPHDVAVAGFDGTVPWMTSVKQPFFEMGREAAIILLGKLKGELKGLQQKTFPGKLVINASTTGKNSYDAFETVLSQDSSAEKANLGH